MREISLRYKADLIRSITVLAILIAVLPAEGAFRGDKGRIAFSRNGDLFSMLPGGTDLRAITSTAHDDHWPRWSPDGAHLVFVRDGDLYLMRWVNGLPDPLVRLTVNGDVVGAPSWHPDGTRIAYARLNQGIWSVTLEGASSSQLITGPYLSPAWSPRGDWIAFSDGASLYRSNLESAHVRLTVDPTHQDDQPAWCPDGERIVYRASDAAPGNTRIHYLLPFRPVPEGGFVGGGVFYGTDSEPACRPDATPDAFLGALPEVVITRRNSWGGTDIAVGPLPNSLNADDPWFRVVIGGDASRNAEADWQPKLAWDTRVLETNTQTVAAVRVTVPVSLPRPLVLNWSLLEEGATPGDDYQHATGNVPVGANETEVVIPVTIIGDTVEESDESFAVIVTFPGFESIARVTIIDDDPTSHGPIAVDVAMDRSALYLYADGFAPSIPIQQSAEQVAISPDGTRVAYRSLDSGAYEIWVADTLQPFGTATKLTTVASETTGSEASRPAWSPDGGTIAFVVDGSSIWLMNADGSNKRALTSGDHPTWSPDGFRIAFHRGVGSLSCVSNGCPTSIHVIDADGQHEHKVIGYPGAPSDPIQHQVFPGWDPEWSPDGIYLVYTGQQFISFDGGYSVPRVMLLDFESAIRPGPPLGPGPENPRPLVDPLGPGAAPCQAPAWSPDGERVVYSCRNASAPHALTPPDTLWIADRDGYSTEWTGLGGVSSDWGTWPPNIQQAVMLDPPFSVEFTEADADQSLAIPVDLRFFGGAAPAPIQVAWQIVPETATGADYSPAEGVITFNPGDTTMPLSLIIHGDDESESNESFVICFTADANINTCQRSTRVTIRDDDSGNRAPVTANDVAATPVATDVGIDVLANDSDPDGNALTLIAVGATANGTTTFAGGTVTYTPNPGFEGVEQFLYTVSDGALTANGAISVYVGADPPVPPPSVLTVSPPFLDFGVVPVNKTRDLIVTVTNATGAPVSMAESWLVMQGPPYPFDTTDYVSICAHTPVLPPGASCTKRVRFWSVTGAGAASPTSIVIMDRTTFAPIAMIPMFASVGPPDVGPNTPPTAADDLAAVAPGFTHTLDALRNDTDPEDDLLRIVTVVDPPHGTARAISCGTLYNPNSDCLEYRPDEGYTGLDAIPYTVSDGRGGTASAIYHLAVGNVVPIVAAISPDRGPLAGGQSIRITGGNFLYRSTVAFVCNNGVFPLDITSLTDNEILATTPPALAGVCDVQVRTVFGQTGVLANAYTYEAEGLAAVRLNVLFEDAGLALGEQACFELWQDSSPVRAPQCISAIQNAVVFSDVPLGSYSAAVAYQLAAPPALPQPRLPNRYVVPPAIPVTVTHDGVTEIVAVETRLRKLRVGATDPNGVAVGPMCYRLSPVDASSGAPVQETCSFPVFGAHVAQFVNVLSGIQYRVEITNHPAGLLPFPGQDVQIIGPFDHTTEINSATFSLSGDVFVRLLGPDGTLFPAQCIAIVTATFVPNDVAYACDSDDGQIDGITRFSALAPGGYAAIPRPFPAGPYGWTSRGTPFTVAPEGSVGEVVTYQLQPARTATIDMIDDAGARVLAGCLQIQDGSDRVGDGVRCDGDDGSTDGVVHFIHLPAPVFRHEVWAASFSPVPPGHLSGPNVHLTYDSNGHARATYVWRLLNVTAVRLLGLDGNLFPGQCIVIRTATFVPQDVIRLCDADDGQTDGITFFSSLAPGGYAAMPLPFPVGPYGWTSRGTPFSVPEGVNRTGEVVTYQLQPARTATIDMINDAGARVLAGCLQIQDGSDRVGDGVRCDGDDGSTDGVVHFIHLPAPVFRHEVWAASFSPVPPGHLSGPNVHLTYDSNGHARATYVWRLLNVTAVRLLGLDGNLFPGQCIVIRTATFVPQDVIRLCDADDGQTDGITFFSSLAPGGYAAMPLPFPVGPYGWTSRGTPFSVPEGVNRTGEVVTYQLQPARTATIDMINDAGARVLAGCLQIQDGSDRVGDGVRCDGDDGSTDGVVHFIHLPAPVFRHEVWAASFSPVPPGHLSGPNVHLTYDNTLHVSDTYVWRIRPATADLSITASASPSPVNVGSLITYTVAVTNNGPDFLLGVNVALPVMSSETFQSSSPVGVCTGPTPGIEGTITCASGDLGAGAHGQLSIQTRLVSGGTRTATVTVSGNGTDPNPANNLASTQVVVTSVATTTVLTSSRNPSLTTAPPVFTATVESAAGLAVGGQVEFLRNGVAFGTSPVFQRGAQFVAVIGGANLDVAGSPHTITARYLGDATHLTSDSAPIQQTVLAGTYFNEVVAGVPAGFAPVALNDLGQIAGNRGNATISRGAVYDSVLGYRLVDATAGFSEALDLNAAGTVVGRFGEDSTTTMGFVFGNGSLTPIERSTVAVGVNGHEQVAIDLVDGQGAGLYQNGTIASLDQFEARAINDAGAVVGSVDPGDGQPFAILWQNGAITDLGRFGFPFATATHVTNDGTVLVQGGDASGEMYPILFRDGVDTPIGVGRAWDINDAGVVAGGTEAARVYLGGTWTTLGIGNVTGMAINNLGHVVGSVSNQLRLWTPVPTSSLVVNSVSGIQDDETTLTATLTTNGGPAAGYSIAFSLNGSFVGSATTGSNGVAVLEGVSLCCVAVGVHPTGVQATFAGNRTLGATTANAQLTIEALNPADVRVIASTPTPIVTIGSNFTYVVTMSNLGPSSAMVLRLNVALPAGLQYISDTALGACQWAGGSGTCDFDNFGVTSRTIAIVARPLTGTPQTASFVVSAPQYDPNPANNTALVTVDARPTVTINQAASQTDPATVAPIDFTVVFSEPVTGFTNTDVAFAGSTVGGTLTSTVTGSGATYTVSVRGMSGVGLVAVSLPAGAAVDSGGIPSAASTSTDRTVLYGVSTVIAMVSPNNGGNAALTVLRVGNSINGILFYSRGSVTLTATRFTSLVINGQTATLEGFSSNNRFFIVTVRDGGAGQPDTFRLWIEGVEQTAGGAISTGTVLVQPWSVDTRLRGWVDLHTHPMSNLAFGGKLFHGAPSVGSLMPAVQMPNDPECRFDQRATSINEALSQDGPTRGNAVQSICGNFVRQALITALELANSASVAPAGADGYPAFTHWPKWNDITHQKMWIDWIRRAWDGGQRVMVALSHNNRTLADLLGGGGAISGVRTDRASSDLQIDEIKRLVADHPDFMAVARTPDELHTIVEGGRLAVVLGVEIDKIGDFSTGIAPSELAIDNEIARLYAQGVRYILPIHLTDNAFGDAAIYQAVYNVVNFRENQSFFTVGCAPSTAEIGFRLTALPAALNPFLLPGMLVPSAPNCVQGGTFRGHVNARQANGLTGRGEYAIRAMMRRGIIVDIDHMSDRAANRTLAIANAVPGGGYPITSGHSAVRDRNSHFNAENSRTTTQLARIACLGGMFGLGTDGADGYQWAAHYERGYNAMRRAFAPNGLCASTNPLGSGFIGLGTDANSLVKTPAPTIFSPVGPPRFTDIYNPNPTHPNNAGVSPLSRSTTGTKTWDYNFDGVAHYGMFVDFLRDVRTWNPDGAMRGRQIVDDQMMYGADYFYRMWLKADTQKARVP